MSRLSPRSCCALLAVAGLAASARAADYITLKNGFNFLCDHRAAAGEKIRLYMDAAGSNFVEVNASDIASEEDVTVSNPPPSAHSTAAASVQAERLSDADLKPILETAGAAHDLDADLLASVIRAESAGHTHAVSRTGAQGLMQLMPGTATHLGVTDSFAPDENIAGGTAYLDSLLKRYNDNLALALAAYNAGPAAVDRWHGIPPYRETRAYVARVIHEYNHRYELRHRAELRLATAQSPAR